MGMRERNQENEIRRLVPKVDSGIEDFYPLPRTPHTEDGPIV